MTKRLSLTPLLNADRERRGRCYVAADFIFDQSLEDDFTSLVPSELTQYIKDAKSTLKKLGITLVNTSSDGLLRVSVEMLYSPVVTQNPGAAIEALQEILLDLQTKFVCSFDRTPYVDERLDTFLGKPFSVPVPTIELGSASGRRLVLQQMTAIRRDVDRQLAILTEREAELRGNNVLDEVMKAQQQTNYQTLRTALLEKKSQAETDMSGEILAALGKMSVDAGVGDIPQASIIENHHEDLVAEEEEETVIDISHEKLDECQSKREVIGHRIMQAALKKVEVKPSPLIEQTLARVFLEPNQTEKLITSIQDLLQKVDQTTTRQLRMALACLAEALEFSVKNPGVSISMGGLPQAALKDYENSCLHSTELHFPETAYYLLHLMEQCDNDPNWENEAWTESVLGANAEVYAQEMFLGKQLPEGRVTKFMICSGLRGYPDHWADLGEVYEVTTFGSKENCIYHKKDNELKRLTISCPNGEAGPLDLPVVSLGVIESATMASTGEKVHSFKRHRAKNERKTTLGFFDYIHIENQDGTIKSVCVKDECFAPVEALGQAVSQYNEIPMVNVKISAGKGQPVNLELLDGQRSLLFSDEGISYHFYLDGQRITSIDGYQIIKEFGHRLTISVEDSKDTKFNRDKSLYITPNGKMIIFRKDERPVPGGYHLSSSALLGDQAASIQGRRKSRTKKTKKMISAVRLDDQGNIISSESGANPVKFVRFY